MINPTELTDKQIKAYKSLKRAIKKCEDANVYWYQNLDTLNLLNGDVVFDVATHDFGNCPDGAFDLFHESPWCVTTTCSFADDAHHVIFK